VVFGKIVGSFGSVAIVELGGVGSFGPEVALGVGQVLVADTADDAVDDGLGLQVLVPGGDAGPQRVLLGLFDL